MPALLSSCTAACIFWWREEPKINRSNRCRFWGLAATQQPISYFSTLAGSRPCPGAANPWWLQCKHAPQAPVSCQFRGEWLSLASGCVHASWVQLGDTLAAGEALFSPWWWQYLHAVLGREQSSRYHGEKQAGKCQGWQLSKTEKQWAPEWANRDQATSQFLVRWDDGSPFL